MKGKRPGGWVALAWRWSRDPRWEGVSDAAKLLWIEGLCWSAEHGTDGRVPLDLRPLAPRRHQSSIRNCAQGLLNAGLWVRYPDGGMGIDPETWNRWQETSEQRAAARSRNAERNARWRAERRVSDASRDAAKGKGQGQVAPYGATPDPPAPGEEIEIEWKTDDRGYGYVSGPWLNGQS